MVNSKPDLGDNSFFELREAAAVLGVSKSTIQRWTNEGLLKCSIRKTNRRKVWSGQELVKAWTMMM